MAYTVIVRGDEVVVIDNLSTGVRRPVPEHTNFLDGNVADEDAVGRRFKDDETKPVLDSEGPLIFPEFMDWFFR